eukprot:COSAG02_NODE_193_length_29843_cov_30.519903_36_plen_62_part_00
MYSRFLQNQAPGYFILKFCAVHTGKSYHSVELSTCGMNTSSGLSIVLRIEEGATERTFHLH